LGLSTDIIVALTRSCRERGASAL